MSPPGPTPAVMRRLLGERNVASWRRSGGLKVFAGHTGQLHHLRQGLTRRCVLSHAGPEVRGQPGLLSYGENMVSQEKMII